MKIEKNRDKFLPHWMFAICIIMLSLFLVGFALYNQYSTKTNKTNWDMIDTLGIIVIALFILRTLLFTVHCNETGFSIFRLKKGIVHVDYLEIIGLAKIRFVFPIILLSYMRGLKKSTLYIFPLDDNRGFIARLAKGNPSIGLGD